MSNVFSRDRTAIRLRESHENAIEGNVFITCGETVKEDEKCTGTRQGDNQVLAGADSVLSSIWKTVRKDVPAYKPPETAGSLHAFLPKGTRRGREYILIDEWGPYDFKEPKVWPARISAGREGQFFLFGPEGDFKVKRVPVGVIVEPTEGEVPGKFTVRAATPGLHTFEIGVEAGGEELTARATLLNVAWTVNFFHWDPKEDPREDQKAWDRLLKTEPVDVIETDTLNFQWGGGGPSEKVNADHFGTLATTTIGVPAGTYEIRTVSDDGIRLWVDGKLVIENWTWHGPTEDKGTIELESGEHEVRIEHFEIDGWTVLSFSLARL
jgi:hypothetical protein